MSRGNLAVLPPVRKSWSCLAKNHHQIQSSYKRNPPKVNILEDLRLEAIIFTFSSATKPPFVLGFPVVNLQGGVLFNQKHGEGPESPRSEKLPIDIYYTYTYMWQNTKLFQFMPFNTQDPCMIYLPVHRRLPPWLGDA